MTTRQSPAGTAPLRRVASFVAMSVISVACSAAATGHTGSGSHASARTRLVVDARRTSWQLPRPIARAVALADGSDAILAGGLSVGNVSSAGVYRLDVATGSLHQIGSLAAPVHDAAGAMIGGQTFVFGGGAQTTTDSIQRVGASGHGSVVGRLPQPRSDLSAATIGGRVFLLGGYTGSSLTPGILDTGNGTAVTQIGSLPVTVRYGATVSDGHHVWVFGGAHGTQPTDAIQRIDSSGASRVVAHLPTPLTEATALDVDGTILIAGGRTDPNQTSNAVYAFDPPSNRITPVAHLPVPVADASGAVIGGTGYLFGGENATQVSTVQELTVSHVRVMTSTSPSAPGSGHAAPVQPPPFVGQLLVADRGNNRLLVVDAAKHILWQYPSANRPAPPSGFYFPDDAFFIHGGTGIISNQEGNDTLVEIGYPSGRPLWSYGHKRIASPKPGFLNQPDDSYLLRDGRVVVADANNCRIAVISSAGRQLSQIGTPGNCTHHPPGDLGYPNGDTPLADGNILISEVHGSWISEYTLTGHLVWTVQLARVSYPSDPQQIGPDRYLVADYAHPGGLFEFDRSGHILWSYHPSRGKGMLDHPSLAEVLPGGLIAVNDDYRHRVVLIDPATMHIVWQYGHTGVPGTGPGYLNTPDGFDLLAPDGTTPTHHFTG